MISGDSRRPGLLDMAPPPWWDGTGVGWSPATFVRASRALFSSVPSLRFGGSRLGRMQLPRWWRAPRSSRLKILTLSELGDILPVPFWLLSTSAAARMPSPLLPRSCSLFVDCYINLWLEIIPFSILFFCFCGVLFKFEILGSYFLFLVAGSGEAIAAMTIAVVQSCSTPFLFQIFAVEASTLSLSLARCSN